MSNTHHDTRKGINYFTVSQNEFFASWGESHGSILRSVEFEDEGDGKTFAVTMYTDHKGRSATPLTLSMTLHLPVEYLDDIIETLSGIRTRAEQQRQAKAEWKMKKQMMEFMPDPPMKLVEENDG